MVFTPPDQFNIADYFLDARVREGKGDRTALLTDHGMLTYRDVQAQANRFGHLLRWAGVEPEQRVLIALPDGPEFVAALFGTLKVGAVVVMVNPQLAVEAIEPETIALREDGVVRTMRNDSVIISAGGILPSEFLRSVGIEIDTKYGTA